MSEQPDLATAWEQAKKIILDEMGDFNRSLWEGVTLAKPLQLDGDTLVLGIPPGKMATGSLLTSTAHGQLVRDAASRALGRTVQVVLVEGTDAGAWEREKQRRETLRELAERQAELKRAAAATTATWAALYEEVGRIFGQTRDRRFPTSRAAMMAKALLATRDAEARAVEADPDATELHTQQLNRTLERIALLAEVPSTMAAVEYMRVKALKHE